MYPPAAFPTVLGGFGGINTVQNICSDIFIFGLFLHSGCYETIFEVHVFFIFGQTYILRESISLGERMRSPLIGGKLDGLSSMTWLTCMDLVMYMSYMSDGVYVLCLGGIYCTNWVRNSAEIQLLECEYPLCDLFRA